MYRRCFGDAQASPVKQLEQRLVAKPGSRRRGALPGTVEHPPNLTLTQGLGQGLPAHRGFEVRGRIAIDPFFHQQPLV